jgi:hypothetical protein
MGFTHGIQGSLTWTAGFGEGNAGIYVATLHRIRQHAKRRMVDVTPFGWNAQEWLPDQYGWTADVEGYMLVNQNPGFFNQVAAQMKIYSSTAYGDAYSGTVWIEEMHLLLATDDVTQATFLIRGSGTLGLAF